jgi:hypothetical protein
VSITEATELLPEELQSPVSAKEWIEHVHWREMDCCQSGSLEDLKGMHPPNFVGFCEPPSMA